MHSFFSIYIIYTQYTQYILQDWYICLKIRYPEISWSITICGIQTTRDTADTPYFQSAFGQALWSYYKSHRAEMVQLQRRRAVLERANAQQNAQPKNTESHEASLGVLGSWVFLCVFWRHLNLSDCSLRSREKQLGISMMPHIQNVWPFPEEDTIHVRLWKETPFRKTQAFFSIFSCRCVSIIINNHQ